MIKHSFDLKKTPPTPVRPITPRPSINLKETRAKIEKKVSKLRKV